MESLTKHFDEIKYTKRKNKLLCACLKTKKSKFRKQADRWSSFFYIRKDFKHTVQRTRVIIVNLWLLGIKIEINPETVTIVGTNHLPNESHALFLHLLKDWLGDYLPTMNHSFF